MPAFGLVGLQIADNTLRLFSIAHVSSQPRTGDSQAKVAIAVRNKCLGIIAFIYFSRGKL